MLKWWVCRWISRSVRTHNSLFRTLERWIRISPSFTKWLNWPLNIFSFVDDRDLPVHLSVSFSSVKIKSVVNWSITNWWKAKEHRSVVVSDEEEERSVFLSRNRMTSIDRSPSWRMIWTKRNGNPRNERNYSRHKRNSYSPNVPTITQYSLSATSFVSSSRSLQCPICAHSFLNGEFLQAHIHRRHPDLDPNRRREHDVDIEKELQRLREELKHKQNDLQLLQVQKVTSISFVDRWESSSSSGCRWREDSRARRKYSSIERRDPSLDLEEHHSRREIFHASIGEISIVSTSWPAWIHLEQSKSISIATTTRSWSERITQGEHESPCWERTTRTRMNPDIFSLSKIRFLETSVATDGSDAQKTGQTQTTRTRSCRLSSSSSRFGLFFFFFSYKTKLIVWKNLFGQVTVHESRRN